MEKAKKQKQWERFTEHCKCEGVKSLRHDLHFVTIIMNGSSSV